VRLVINSYTCICKMLMQFFKILSKITYQKLLIDKISAIAHTMTSTP